MKFFARFVLGFVLTASLSPNAFSQTAASTDKRLAIQELMNLIGATQFAKSIFVTLVDQYSQALAKDSVTAFEKKNWSPSSKAKAKELAEDFYSRVSQRLRNELPTRIQYDEVVGKLYLEAYDAYFTAAEIKELIAFYRSPVGQKFLSMMPRLSTELQQKATAQLEPQTQVITREIVNEELKRLEKRAANELKTSRRN